MIARASRDLAETLNETHYLLPGMTEDELRQAIVEPAEIKNGHIEEALVERLIEDIRGQEDQLPILQHTLAVDVDSGGGTAAAGAACR